MSALVAGVSNLDGVLDLVLKGGPEFVARLQELGEARESATRALENLALGEEVVRLRDEAALAVQQSNSLRVEAEAILTSTRQQADQALREATAERDSIVESARSEAKSIREDAERDASSLRASAASDASRMKSEAATANREAQIRAEALAVEQARVAEVIERAQEAEKKAEMAYERWTAAVVRLNAVIETA